MNLRPLALSLLLSAFYPLSPIPYPLPPYPLLPAQDMPGASYHVVKKIPVGGDGGWDYVTVDTAGNRLFVTRGTHVQVIDLATDKLVADLENTSGVHGVALAYDLGKLFTSNGRDSTVSVFDLRTLEPAGTIKVTGRNPDAILYDPTTHRVFTFNGGSANATAIDAKTNEVVGTVAIGGKPETGNDDGHGRIFVNNEDSSEVVVFDAAALAVQAHWKLAGCEEPTGQGIDRAK